MRRWGFRLIFCGCEWEFDVFRNLPDFGKLEGRNGGKGDWETGGHTPFPYGRIIMRPQSTRRAAKGNMLKANKEEQMTLTFLYSRLWLLLLLFGSAGIASAQEQIQLTDQLTITGEVKQELVYTLADIDTFATRKLQNLPITSHNGELRGTMKRLRGIPVKELLKPVEFTAESPKVLSEFYFTFVAADGYKVVYSWNELFNAATGEQVYILTEKDGKGLRDMEERIAAVCLTDVRTGRRYVKGLERIVVGRVE